MHLFSIQVLFHLFVLMWDKNNSILGQECGAVVNNSLSSPGFPNNYPPYTYCTYRVPIPEGTSLIIQLEFDLEYATDCRFDYLKITDEKGTSLGLYCGKKTEETVEVTGEYAGITFRSDFGVQRKGFWMIFRVKENGSSPTTIGMDGPIPYKNWNRGEIHTRGIAELPGYTLTGVTEAS